MRMTWWQIALIVEAVCMGLVALVFVRTWIARAPKDEERAP